MLGETLGSYRIVEQLGEGGMGVVYVAEHTLLGNKAAIKFLHSELSRNQEVVQRFFNEALAATKIAHSAIVKVFDYGHAKDGSAYIVMEYLAGESLGARLRTKRPLSPEAVVTIGEQAAGALAAAHKSGIVHRDLKPDNIFLVPDPVVPGGERVKLLDFGIAKLSAEATESHSMTRTGSMLGTPYYMSPEQCRGAGQIDHRSDIYSLGCVLFEMATGSVPFLGEGLGEILGAHQHLAPPAARSINPACPEELEAFLARLLAKDPQHRPQSMYDVAAELQRLRALYAGIGAVTPPAGVPVYAPPGGTPTPTRPSGFAAGTSTTLGSSAGQSHASTLPPSGSGAAKYLIGGLLAAGAVGAGVFFVLKDKDKGENTPVVEPKDPIPKDPEPPPRLVVDGANAWVRIDAPSSPVVLGVNSDAGDDVRGWRPDRNITAPSKPFAIQQHEVTWEELEPWLDSNKAHAFDRPAWVPKDAAARAKLPVTGAPWATANAYCVSIGGRLPTEEQWEYAARGAELRTFPWGKQRIDFERTHAYAGKKASVIAVMTRDQDVTPGSEAPIYDLMGNAQEWTADLWREDRAGQDESWVQAGGMTFRAMRGLPVAGDPPKNRDSLTAAYREVLCSAGPCIEDAKPMAQYVGFRCVRNVR